MTGGGFKFKALAGLAAEVAIGAARIIAHGFVFACDPTIARFSLGCSEGEQHQALF